MTRTVGEQITQAGVQKSASPIRAGPLLDPGRPGRGIYLCGLLLSSPSPPGSMTPISLGCCWGPGLSAASPLIVPLGGELFTGCTRLAERILYDGRIRLAGTLRVWALAYLGNLLGILVLCLLLAGSGSRGSCWGLSGPDRPGQAVRPWYLLLLRVCCAISGMHRRVRRLPPPERDRVRPWGSP